MSDLHLVSLWICTETDAPLDGRGKTFRLIALSGRGVRPTVDYDAWYELPAATARPAVALAHLALDIFNDRPKELKPMCQTSFREVLT